MTLLSPTDSINGLGEKLASAFRNKEAIQDIPFRATNSLHDDFPELLKRTRNIDRWNHLSRWKNQNFRSGNRGYSEIDRYLLFPLPIIEKVSNSEMIRMLPLGRRFYPTTRELLAFQIENRRVVNRLLLRHRYRIVALGADDFDPIGRSPAFIRSAQSSIVLDRIADNLTERWGPKCLILFRYPSRST